MNNNNYNNNDNNNDNSNNDIFTGLFDNDVGNHLVDGASIIRSRAWSIVFRGNAINVYRPMTTGVWISDGCDITCPFSTDTSTRV